MRERFRNLARWLLALLVWLAEKRHVWLGRAVCALALVASLRPGTTEPVIRYSGLTLHLLGICTVVWGISETRALFNHPTLLAAVKAWARKFPRYRPTTVGAAANLVSGSATMTGRAYGTFGAGPNPSLEARVEAAEKNIAAINNRLDQTIAEMDAHHRQQVDAVRAETEARASADAALHKKLEATGTGGVHISLVGALWLFLGSVPGHAVVTAFAAIAAGAAVLAMFASALGTVEFQNWGALLHVAPVFALLGAMLGTIVALDCSAGPTLLPRWAAVPFNAPRTRELGANVASLIGKNPIRLRIR